MSYDETSIIKHPIHFISFLLVSLIAPHNFLLNWAACKCITCRKRVGPWSAYMLPEIEFNVVMCPSCKILEEEASDITEAYGLILEQSPPLPWTVSDITKLPYSKEKIKRAIIFLYFSTSPKSEIIDMVSTCYMSLAHWQKDVGDSDVEIKIAWDNSDELQDVEASQCNDDTKWLLIINGERKQLKSELKRFGVL